MGKKILCTACVISIMFLLCSCSDTNKDRFEAELFSDYYKSASYFDDLAPLVCSYLNLIDSAYNKSDQINFETFQYDVEELGSLYNKIEEFSDKIMNTENPNTDENIANLGLIYYCAKIQTNIAEMNLLKDAIANENNEEWFINLKNDLDEACESFSNYEE